MLSFITLQSWGKIWSGTSDHWTIFWTVFLDKFLDLFFYPIFLWIILWGGGGGREHTISTQGVVGCSQSVLRETVITSGRVGDELLVEVNATD